jgi:hypothetical protein
MVNDIKEIRKISRCLKTYFECENVKITTNKIAKIIADKSLSDINNLKNIVEKSIKFKKSFHYNKSKTEQYVNRAIESKNIELEQIKQNVNDFITNTLEDAYEISCEERNSFYFDEMQRLFPSIAREEIKRKFTDVRKICMSNIQSAKSTTGYIFQHIIEKILKTYGFLYEQQFGDSRSDFAIFLDKVNKDLRNPICLLSLKYNLRERWAESIKEFNYKVPVYLLSCDKDITNSKIKEILNHNIILVGNEIAKLKNNELCCFNDFFSKVLPEIFNNARNKNN